jgi:hypothetical protein
MCTAAREVVAAATGSAGAVMSPSPPAKHQWQQQLLDDPPGSVGEATKDQRHTILQLDGDIFICSDSASQLPLPLLLPRPLPSPEDPLLIKTYPTFVNANKIFKFEF